MGLLEKATRIRENRPRPSSGLYGRLLDAQSRSRESAPEKKGTGLFERARQLRQAAIGRGLFARAAQLREAQSPVHPALIPEPSLSTGQEKRSLLARAQSMQSSLPPEKTVTGEEAHGLLFSGDELTDSESLAMPLFSPESDLEQPRMPDMGEPDIADWPSDPYTSDLSEPELPEDLSSGNGEKHQQQTTGIRDEMELPSLDFSFEDQSSIDDDPAYHEDAPEALPDPFREWEDEAGREAEKATRDILHVDEGHALTGEEGIMTMPVETHIASQKRIDNYLALFELNRELNAIDQLEDFWDAVLYAVLGQVGARTVVIFAPRVGATDSLHAVAASGLLVPEEWVLRTGEVLFDALAGSEEIRYAGEFTDNRSGISVLEREILEKSRASMILPLKSADQFEGVILIGPPLETADYVIDDLEFLRLLAGNILGPLQRIQNISQHAEETALLQRENALHRILSSMAATAQSRKTVDEIYDLLLDFFRRELGVESLSLVLLDPPEQVYRIFAGNRISPASLQKFRLPVGMSELIGTISNLSGIYNLVDFQTHPEILANYTGDDLALMQNYYILPLINLNWLVGFLTIHRTHRVWTDLDRDVALAAANQMAAVLANCIILKERETLFRDPFSPLEKRLERELEKAMEFHSFLSIVDFRVRNLKKLLGANDMAGLTEFFTSLSRTISRNLYQTDYMTRMGAGRFVLLLPGRGRAEAGIFSERLQIELKQTPLLRGSAVTPAYECEVINFPEDADSMQKLIALLDR